MILLDTQVVLWLLAAPDRLSKPAMSAIRRARKGGGLAICSVTLYEIAYLLIRSRIKAERPSSEFLDDIASRFVLREITPEIALTAAHLQDPFPKDPMDRLIGATALVEGLPLLTADERIRSSTQVKTIW